MEIELKAHAEAVSLNPGDVVVIRTDHLLTKEQEEFFKSRLSPMFPDNFVLILPPGASFNVVKPDRHEYAVGSEPLAPIVPGDGA